MTGKWQENNGIIRQIDRVLHDDQVPVWARVMLICMRDDHRTLTEHLDSHKRWAGPFREVLVAVLTAATMLAFSRLFGIGGV